MHCHGMPLTRLHSHQRHDGTISKLKVVETHPSCAGGGVNRETVLHEAASSLVLTMRLQTHRSHTVRNCLCSWC
jgi:hypothetical protein